jgi:hypothetical protein
MVESVKEVQVVDATNVHYIVSDQFVTAESCETYKKETDAKLDSILAAVTAKPAGDAGPSAGPSETVTQVTPSKKCKLGHEDGESTAAADYNVLSLHPMAEEEEIEDSSEEMEGERPEGVASILEREKDLTGEQKFGPPCPRCVEEGDRRAPQKIEVITQQLYYSINKM